jgi:hypothetical protein
MAAPDYTKLAQLLKDALAELATFATAAAVSPEDVAAVHAAIPSISPLTAPLDQGTIGMPTTGHKLSAVLSNENLTGYMQRTALQTAPDPTDAKEVALYQNNVMSYALEMPQSLKDQEGDRNNWPYIADALHNEVAYGLASAPRDGPVPAHP